MEKSLFIYEAFPFKNRNILTCLFCNRSRDYFLGILKHAIIRIIDVDYYLLRNEVMK